MNKFEYFLSHILNKIRIFLNKKNKEKILNKENLNISYLIVSLKKNENKLSSDIHYDKFFNRIFYTIQIKHIVIQIYADYYA